MDGPSRFATAGAFRQSLEERLKQFAKNQGTDLSRLRRRVAFERLLARLFMEKHPRWLLKGGYAIELRLQEVARATKDIDLCMHDTPGQVLQRQNPQQMLRELLQDDLARKLDDWFTFRLSAATADLRAAPLGGARFPVNAQLDNRLFARFNLDVGLGDAATSEPEWITGHELLSFAGIPPARIAMVPLDQQFAEKIHAYTFPRKSSRVRDLIDLVLLIENGLPEPAQIIQALKNTFARRNTYPLPTKLMPPPEEWRDPYEAVADECHVDATTLETAYERLTAYWNQLDLSAGKRKDQLPKKS
ncbi:MAG: nucleotidyl transferase AbiEii/AbiGii toxin family protein [Nitrospira sp.]|nr:nucleotidyl transferase AbiEii/AbiGii toxin family protein [Nitrospira sp.]MDE0405729.1 nucleotidyl transferase AbiEii/AbiGii toxin family protein [Nitrospira sp.]MDE0485589.1 nucleotidyl transferase AbiEii/AbiGii toxin family protein [Nitrospira sp.]